MKTQLLTSNALAASEMDISVISVVQDKKVPAAINHGAAHEVDCAECRRRSSTAPAWLSNVQQVKEMQSTIWRNVGLLTLGTHIIYSAYFGIACLQMVLNSDQPEYQMAYLMTLCFYALASYFFPAVCISRLGLKKTVVITFLLLMSYIIANYVPSWYTLVPTGVLRGVGGGIFWNVKGTVLATLGNLQSKITGESNEFTIPRFFGIFFGGYQASYVTAIMVSSFLIHKPAALVDRDNILLQEDCIERYCYDDIGHFFPNYNATARVPTGDAPPVEKYSPDEFHTNLLYGMFTALGVFAVTVALFITADKRLTGQSRQPVTPFSLVIASVKHIFQPFDLLLLPSYLYIGVVDAFSGSELTMGFIPCSSGVDNIGYVFTIFGVVSALFGVLGGYAVKYTGRQVVFLFGFLVHAAVLFAMQYTTLDYKDPLTIFFVSSGWGIAAVILDVQISAFIGCVYPEDSAPVIANFIIFQILGNSAWRLFSRYMCLHVQLYVIMILLFASMVGYIIIEIVLHKKSESYRVRRISTPPQSVEVLRY